MCVIFDCQCSSRVERGWMQPAESTPAVNTHRRAAFRIRCGSVSSVGSMDETLIHRPTQQQPLQLGARDPHSTSSSTSFTLLPGPGASNVRVTGEGLPVEANPGLRNQQNHGPDPAVAALLQSMSQLLAMFAAQSASNNIAVTTLSSQLEAQSSAFERQLAANSVVHSAITDRLNHLEQNLETRPGPSNRDHRQSAGAPSRPPSPTDPELRFLLPREQSESSAHLADQTYPESPAITDATSLHSSPSSPDSGSLVSCSRTGSYSTCKPGLGAGRSRYPPQRYVPAAIYGNIRLQNPLVPG